jgi:hypothetical protein
MTWMACMKAELFESIESKIPAAIVVAVQWIKLTVEVLIIVGRKIVILMTILMISMVVFSSMGSKELI